MEKKAWNARQFATLCFGLLRRTSEIISEVKLSGVEGKIMKKEDDPVTLADFRSQYIIKTGIHNIWPNLKIIGEEADSKLLKTEFDFSSVSIDMPLKELDFLDLNFDIDDLVVYVDPLDGTKAYVNGTLQDCTTLIGVSYKSKPLLGLIAHMWPNKIDVLEPIVYVAIVSSPQVVSYKVNTTNDYHFLQKYPAFSQQPISELKGPLKISVSVNNYDPEVENLLKYFEEFGCLEKSHVTGMGSKYLKVMKGEIDGTIQNQSGAGRWDTLAGTALMEALGGFSTDIRGDQYLYNGDKDHVVNESGILILNSAKIFEAVTPKFRAYYEKLGMGTGPILGSKKR